MEQRKTGNEAIIFAQDAAVKDLAQTEAWLKSQCMYSEVGLLYRLGFPYIFCGEDEMAGLRAHSVEQIGVLPSLSVEVLNGDGVYRRDSVDSKILVGILASIQSQKVNRVETIEKFLAESMVAGKLRHSKETFLARLSSIMNNQDSKYRIWQVVLAPQTLMLKVVSRNNMIQGAKIDQGEDLDDTALALGYITIEIPEDMEITLRLRVHSGNPGLSPMRKMIYQRQFQPDVGWCVMLSEWRRNQGIQVYRYYLTCGWRVTCDEQRTVGDSPNVVRGVKISWF